MANTVAITKLIQGRNSLFHVYFMSDGASGELVDQVLIDPVADLGLTSAERMVVYKIGYSFAGFVGRIEFDSGLIDDKMIWVINETSDAFDFKEFGGFKDRAGVDGTGKLQITTTGFTDVGDQGSLYIWVKA